jgi:hypothetical protein
MFGEWKAEKQSMLDTSSEDLGRYQTTGEDDREHFSGLTVILESVSY